MSAAGDFFTSLADALKSEPAVKYNYQNCDEITISDMKLWHMHLPAVVTFALQYDVQGPG